MNELRTIVTPEKHILEAAKMIYGPSPVKDTNTPKNKNVSPAKRLGMPQLSNYAARQNITSNSSATRNVTGLNKTASSPDKRQPVTKSNNVQEKLLNTTAVSPSKFSTKNYMQSTVSQLLHKSATIQ
jgi:hypothetical protein